MFSSHLRVDIPKYLVLVDLAFKMFTLTKCLAHPNILDLITLTTLGERYKL